MDTNVGGVLSNIVMTEPVVFVPIDWKALPLMLVTPCGISMDARDVQFWKALAPMLVTPCGISMDARDVQFWKALPPILVTPCGISMDASKSS